MASAEEIRDEYLKIPEYVRETAIESLCWIVAGVLSDELSKLPYSELPDAEFNHLLVGVADELVADIRPRVVDDGDYNWAGIFETVEQLDANTGFEYLHEGGE